MPRRGRLNEQQLDELRRAYRDVDSASEEEFESFEERAAFERDHLSDQILNGVQSLLQQRGLTQKDLAKTLCVSTGRVSQILSGEQNLTLQTLAGLAAALEGHVLIRFTDDEGLAAEDYPHPRVPAQASTSAARARWEARASQGV